VHHCNAAFSDGRSCESAFASVAACSSIADATLLGGGPETEPGCYYFCPNVPNCAELSLDAAAALLCQYAAANCISTSLGLRPLCGPDLGTKFGPCCFGLDANILYR
jgi:hypothetical protein